MKNLTFTLISLFLFFIGVPQLYAQNNLLGKIDFPNSGNEAAQDDFYEGVLFLHNFEYGDAARAFQRAQEIDPGFAMAYWGEAMTHNHPIWMRQYSEAAMDVLRKLGDSVEERQQTAPTQREKDYLMTLEVLYGNTSNSQGKTKEERDILYSEFLGQLHEKYPNDHEITSFYGLSILGTAHEGRDIGIYMKAAAELFDVWNENQEHPGAAHYLIHSFDDPEHAPLGLPMARAYSGIAPKAAHAQHMTSHIFLAMGMWDEVIDANLVARDVQTSRQQELGEETTVCGHYPWWLQYGYLQDGATDKAAQVLSTCYDRVSGTPSISEKWHFAVMRGHQIVDSENWDNAEIWTQEFDPGTRAAVNYYFTSAYAALQQGDTQLAEEFLNELSQAPESEERDIQINQIEGMLQIEKENVDAGLDLLRDAVQAEAELPVDFGPPVIVKPSYELLGDVLSRLGQYEEAADAYKQQLDRTPDRKRSLIGLESVTKRVAAK